MVNINNTMEYKGYVGSVEFSEEDVIFYGKVMGIRSLISYEGENARELVEGFHEAVDDYIYKFTPTFMKNSANFTIEAFIPM